VIRKDYDMTVNFIASVIAPAIRDLVTFMTPLDLQLTLVIGLIVGGKTNQSLPIMLAILIGTTVEKIVGRMPWIFFPKLLILVKILISD